MKNLNLKSLATAICLLFSLGVSAYDFTVDGMYFNVVSLEDLTCEITSGDEEYAGDFVIPEKVTYNGRTFTVTRIDGYYNSYNDFDGTFYKCTNLTNVTIPNTVTSIGDYAFYGCSGLTNITIGNSVTSIGDYAFYCCSGLTSVEIPNSVTSISSWAFYGCSGLTGIKIPNSVTSISSWAFCNCSGLTGIKIPNSVTSIGEHAFCNCSGLTSVEIPNSVTSISGYVFSGCSGLTSVVIPNSLNSIGNNVFQLCSSLKNVVIEDGNEALEISAYYNYYEPIFSDCPIETLYLGRNLSFELYPPFENNKTLKNVTISSFVTEIGKNLFSDCSELENLIIEDSDEILTVDGAFDKNPIKTLYLGRNLNYNSYYSPFSSVTTFTNVTIGDMVTDVKGINWGGNENLTTIQSLAMTPPMTNSFSNKQYLNTKVYVPEGSLAAYQADEIWKNFWNIQEGEPTGISSVGVTTEQSVKVENGNIVIDDATGLVCVYTVGGTLVKSVKANGRVDIALPGSGVYIIRVNNKTTKIAL